jgi:hypothetical protein
VGAVKDYKLYTQISRAINHSYGTTGPGTARVSTQDVNLQIVDEELLNAKFQMIINYDSGDMLEKHMMKFKKEGLAMIDATLERAIDNYKEMFPDDKAIKFTVNTDTAHDDVEPVYYSYYTPVKRWTRAFYRLSVLVNIK